MNHILHNISIILLAIGIIMITIYITKVTSNNYITNDQDQLINESNKQQLFIPDNVYDYRVSKEYKKMFNESESWLGYQSFDENEPVQKLFIK